MISIKQSLSDLDGRESRFRIALGSYLTTLASFEEHAKKLAPELTEPRRERLRQLRGEIEGDSAEATLQRTGNEVQGELHEITQLVEQGASQKDAFVREVLAVLAEASEVFSVRSDNYGGQIEGVAKNMEAVSRLQDLSEIRRCLSAEVVQLRAWVETTCAENRETVLKMRREIAACRHRLDEAERLAYTDDLTGLGNRREGERELQARIASKAPFCLILIDVNRMRWINDRYGRHCGDQVMKQFAQRLTLQFRAPDTVCRWGGDEFLVVVDGPLGDAMKRAYHIGPRLRGHYAVTAHHGEVKIPVSASLGVAEYIAGESAEKVLARTDSTLNIQRNIEVSV